ncbi:uncharacterized protein ARMOST_18309 [Armillaria ostoyae]|uniref:Uncharacterized protein n=1 Tax=Armillaria ostoyae TaxID=47428 RepID=A0A284S1F0_ARMOS|nr:uncharacterized protein ARMOST_18309 [Armillaria ostoyae]
MAVNGNLAWYLLHASRPRHEVAVRHSHQRRLGNRPVRYELACHFRIDTTDYSKYMSDIQNPICIDLSRQISTSRHPRDMATIANFFRPPRIIESHKQSNARMGQIEAYLAPKTRNESPRSSMTSVPPISAPPSLMRYQ